MLLAVLASVTLWPLYACASALLDLIGLLIVYVLSHDVRVVRRKSRIYPDRWVDAWLPRWAWLWGNEQDGVSGPMWFRELHRGRCYGRVAFLWSALRNPTNNLRFVPFINPVIVPGLVGAIGNSEDPNLERKRDLALNVWRRRMYWCFTWQGIFAGFWWIWTPTPSHHVEVRIGWKLIKRDRHGVPADDYRAPRCGFGVIVHLWRKSS
jgi:hypothetical protein